MNFFWEKFDFLSVQPKIYIKGKDRYKTKFGLVMSVLSFISIGILSAFFIKFYIDKAEINILFYKGITSEELYMDLNNKPFFFSFRDINGKKVDQRLISLTLRHFYNKDGKFSWDTLDVEACSFEKHFPDPKYKKMFENLNLESKLCIKDQNHNLNITDDSKNNVVLYFNLYAHECNNSTLNNNSCYPKEQIRSYMSSANIYFGYYFPDFLIDHYNSSSPLQETFRFTEKKVYSDIIYRFSQFIKPVKYTSDEGAVLQNFKTWNFFGLDEPSSLVYISLTSTSSVPFTLGTFQIYMIPGKVDYYRRSFPKFQTVLAYIGGITKFIWTFSSFISTYITSQMLKAQLAINFICDELKIENKEIKISKKSSFDNKLINSRSMIFNDNLRNKITIHKNHNPLNLENLENNYNCRTKRKGISFLEAILPKIFLNKNSVKHNDYKFCRVINSYMSTDNFLKLFKDFENFKYLYLDEKQIKLFEFMRCSTIDEHYMYLDNINQNLIKNNEINNMINNIDIKNSINEKIINRILEKS